MKWGYQNWPSKYPKCMTLIMSWDTFSSWHSGDQAMEQKIEAYLLFFFPLGFPVINLAQWSLKPLWNQSVSDKQKNDMSLHGSLNTPIYPLSNHQVYLCMRTHTHKPQDTSYCSHMRSSFCSLNLASLILQILPTLLNSFLF